jgi:ACS family hexuronate transporter-like MFS transporter
LVLFELFFAMFIASGFVILPISYATNAFSSAHAGWIAGLGAGSWSAAVAVVMPYFGRLFDQHRYDVAFLVASLFPIAGFGIWFILRNPRVQLT